MAAGLGHGNGSTDGRASAQAAEIVTGRANRACPTIETTGGRLVQAPSATLHASAADHDAVEARLASCQYRRRHVHQSTGLAKRIQDRIVEVRSQQDNELWHLLILQDLLASRSVRESRLKFFWLPHLIAFRYYQLSWLLYVVNPKWSYGLNADFEDHAEHEYMEWVADNPEWETEPFDADLVEGYGAFDSMPDLFRQIGRDERVHKEESIAAMDEPRFK